jgi:hypothetical protein
VVSTVAADFRIVFFALLRGDRFTRLLADLREPLFRLAMIVAGNVRYATSGHRAASRRMVPIGEGPRSMEVLQGHRKQPVRA